MTWEERCRILRDSKADCIVEMEVSERNLADSEQEALKAFADELVKRMEPKFVNTLTDIEMREPSLKFVINEMLHECGVYQ